MIANPESSVSRWTLRDRAVARATSILAKWGVVPGDVPARVADWRLNQSDARADAIPADLADSILLEIVGWTFAYCISLTSFGRWEDVSQVADSRSAAVAADR